MKFDFGMYGIWRTVHIISAICILLYCFVHLILHSSLFKGIIHKRINRQDFEKIWSVSSKVIAVLMSIFVVVTSIKASQSLIRVEHPVIEKNRQYRHQEHSYEVKKKPEDHEEQGQIIEEPSGEEAYSRQSRLKRHILQITCPYLN